MPKTPVRPVRPPHRESAEPVPTEPGDTSYASIPLLVERHLEDFLRERLDSCGRIDGDFAEIAVTRLAEFVGRGGKRLRPLFAWYGWRAAHGAASGPGTGPVLRAMSALELLQAFALIHDDVMDGSRTRRGAPSVHAGFARAHRRERWSGSADGFGTSLAILLGDIALAWADDMLAGAGLSPAQWTAARGPWQAMRTEMMAGQFLDVYGQARRDGSEATALKTNRLKTAAYSVERPLHMGAALAGADRAVVGALRGYGADVGVAFQLRDDLLGVYADPESTGKPAGEDLREGKRTLLVALGLRRARDRGDRVSLAVIEKVLGDPGVDAGGIDAARDALTRLGARDAVEERIRDLADRGAARLDGAAIDPAARDALRDLAVRATVRDH
ncbi:polyprenyl synthetase family protein [Actinorugispora endophytica]|uniref:Geranylgeranyl diphosphate synthase type I n=1 Tax=Actinorugispora endophytica TaxID=1605990 RepID=A0A4R6V5R8_9ACTN|nr:polyprenyl synthetase family protein [Actinorugispora endophytica]TDQ55573.1 geranylgeranyl diphosphate synthase type I [Actinorugispora endophytica]